MARIYILQILLAVISSVLANTEKNIFIAPATMTIPRLSPSLDDLHVIPLSSGYPTVRTHVNASFPTSVSPRGDDSWFLLDGLIPGHRYEVRLCWMATEPTDFWLNTWSLDEVFGEPDLLRSLSNYGYARNTLVSRSEVNELKRRRASDWQEAEDAGKNEAEMSLLLLQVQAAADYFTLNKTLMENVPPVFVDIILDPYIFNVFPQSLLPTAGYVAVFAVIAWFLSQIIWKLLKVYIEISAMDNASSNDGNDEKKKL